MSVKKQNITPGFSISGFENLLNYVIGFIFYYRMVFVIGFLIVISIIVRNTWIDSLEADKLKNISLVFAAGSVVVGIFYSIINYEYSQIKFKNDLQTSKSTLAFTSACDWHRPTMVENLKITKKLFDEYSHLIKENKASDFFGILEKDEPARSALVSIFNFFECIAVGLNHNILDDEFIKCYFSGVVKWYCNYYGFYIEYRRKQDNAPDIWINFTNLAQNWDSKK